MQQKLAEKEKAQKEEHLRMLAMKARESAAAGGARRASRARTSPHGGSRSASPASPRSASPDSDAEEAARERGALRAERRREHERELRQSRMGTERRLQVMAREQGRDISEKIALGLAKPTATTESMYDSRLFNQTAGFDTGFNEDQAYDKPLFAAQEISRDIYRPKVAQDDDGEDAGETLDRINKTSRFDVLGRAPKDGFKGAAEAEVSRLPLG